MQACRCLEKGGRVKRGRVKRATSAALLLKEDYSGAAAAKDKRKELSLIHI